MTITRHSSQRLCRRRGSSRYVQAIFISGLLLLSSLALSSVRAESRDKTTKKSADGQSEEGASKEPYQPLDLKESVRRSMNKDAQDAREKYWRRTLEEIRNLAVTIPPSEEEDEQSKSGATKQAQLNNRWKKFSTNGKETSSTNKPARFDGFFTWERLLQQWSDDVQEYLDKLEEEGNEYLMSTYGRSTSPKDEEEDPVANSPPSPVSVEVETSADSEALLEKGKVPRPVPAPRKPGEAVLPHTDVSDKSKRIWVVTTAALPWMTGTAVNPLLRAAYMCKGRKEAGGSVTLMLPWLERTEDQERVYGADKAFETKEDQEAYVRNWLKNSAKMEEASEELNIEWYTAWQNKAENSVYSMGDIVATISEDDVDIMVLEEPEHLNWYRSGRESWTRKFKHVVGIVHTNYFVYAQDQPGALIRAPAMKLLCTWMCRSHCHRLIKLSGTLGEYAPEKELIENTHGVRGAFVDAGVDLRKKLLSPEATTDPIFSANADPTVYFIGKMLWSKGLGSLMELLKYAEETAGIKLKVDMYGGGPDKDAADAKAQKMDLDMDFLGPVDHSELATTHKIFINPSHSEVLCTTVAEALAMGKFVILPSHPSNDFFVQFPNCLPYASQEEFVGNLYYALTHSPEPLSEEYSYALTWDAATERFAAAACIPVEEAEHYKKWVEAGDAGVEITLPPLIESEEGRKIVASTLRRSRASFRKFRDSLAQEISFTRVLPKKLKDRLIKDLDRRLDLDIDELLSSPKLELNLSPAELDRQCLELYQTITQGPGGDVLRVIGGGQEVALQHQYMRRQARNQLKAAKALNITSPFFVDKSVDDTDEKSRTASQWVKWTMRRNLPANSTDVFFRMPPSPVEYPRTTEGKPVTTHWKDDRRNNNNLHMSLGQSTTQIREPSSQQPTNPWGLYHSRAVAKSRSLSSRSMSKTCTLLI